MSITIIGFAMIAAAVWAWFTPENPEQAGTTPDNVPMSQDQREAYRAESETYISTWTYGKLIRTRQFWLISLGLGLYMMITVGVMSQLVPRLMALGFAQKRKLAGVLGDGMFAFVILAISLTLTGSFSLAYILFVILAFAGAWMIYIINDKEFAD